ncbi:MAG TPA: hypothetical protein ENJ71_02350, partial [Epsilonproteobacteria bacterium]|nr:hypothetical protein [Campylobacterota bacterium]
MYYIVNQTNHIIAADNALLELLSVDTIGELHQNIALNSISLERTSDDEVTINTLVNSMPYAITTHTLTSVLGDMTLIEINESKTDSENEQELFTTEESDFSLLDDEPITFNDAPVTLPPETEEEEKEEDISIVEEDKPFDLILDDEPFLIEDEAEPAGETEPEPEKEEHPEEEEIQSSTETETEDNAPIVINISEISQKIGISEEDYNTFLDEYIDTALTLEEDLKSTQSKKRSHAVATLSHLSNVLHLPVINQIITDIENSDEDKQNTFIRSFYDTLARLTTNKETSDTEEILETVEETPAVEMPEAETPEEETGSKGFGTLDLSDVKPIH